MPPAGSGGPGSPFLSGEGLALFYCCAFCYIRLFLLYLSNLRTSGNIGPIPTSPPLELTQTGCQFPKTPSSLPLNTHPPSSSLLTSKHFKMSFQTPTIVSLPPPVLDYADDPLIIESHTSSITPPRELLCPITLSLFRNPVLAADGFT